MKILSLFVLTFAFPSVHGAEILGGFYDRSARVIELNLRYVGGEKKHEFKLPEHSICGAGYRFGCAAELEDLTTDDRGLQTVEVTVRIPTAGFSPQMNSYRIYGDNGSYLELKP